MLYLGNYFSTWSNPQRWTQKVLSISAVVFGPENKILLIRRENEPYKNLWSFPGGKLEKDEDYIQGTLREVHEETGCKIIMPRFHLLAISSVKQYLIITSIAEEEKVQSKNTRDLEYVHDKIICKWFSAHTISQMKKSEFVPNIQSLVTKANDLRKFNDTRYY